MYSRRAAEDLEAAHAELEAAKQEADVQNKLVKQQKLAGQFLFDRIFKSIKKETKNPHKFQFLNFLSVDAFDLQTFYLNKQIWKFDIFNNISVAHKYMQ